MMANEMFLVRLTIGECGHICTSSPAPSPDPRASTLWSKDHRSASLWLHTTPRYRLIICPGAHNKNVKNVPFRSFIVQKHTHLLLYVSFGSYQIACRHVFFLLPTRYLGCTTLVRVRDPVKSLSAGRGYCKVDVVLQHTRSTYCCMSWHNLMCRKTTLTVSTIIVGGVCMSRTLLFHPVTTANSFAQQSAQPENEFSSVTGSCLMRSTRRDPAASARR